MTPAAWRRKDKTMNARLSVAAACAAAVCTVAAAGEEAAWWNPKWRCRTTVARPTPYRGDRPRPVEAAIDFPLLLERAGVSGRFDPSSLRVVERRDGAAPREVAFRRSLEPDLPGDGQRAYLAWVARPRPGRVGAFDVYFDTKDRRLPAPKPAPADLPPANLLAAPRAGVSAGEVHGPWKATPPSLVSLDAARHAGRRWDVTVRVTENTPPNVSRDVTLLRRIDVRRYAGCEMVFECDLLAAKAAYGAPVCVLLEQYRKDGSRIRDYAVDPRWLTLELARGQLVRLRQRGRFSHEAHTVHVRIRLRCSVRDADTRRPVTGAEGCFTVHLGRIAVRPGERWPWPAATGGGFVEGAIPSAPLNRAVELTHLRRLAFNGASEGTLQARRYGDANSVHWGLRAGTLEFWCRPKWNADDGAEHVFFEGVAYGHRTQSRLRKRGGEGDNRLEFSIADAGGTLRSVRGRARLRAGRWHHLAATWDLRGAHLQLFVDGKRIGRVGPGKEPWPWSTIAVGGKKKSKGIGISEADTRSLPMQAFLGGDRRCRRGQAAEAGVDEFRISDAVRYESEFPPPREEFRVDEHTRALFHFENERHGVHDGDDRFVRGHLACELPPQSDRVPLEVRHDGKVQRRMIVVRPPAPEELFEAGRAENRLPVHRPIRDLPDPRHVAYRPRLIERVVTGKDDGFTLSVSGDYPPLMRSITFRHAGTPPDTGTTPLPRWRANDNVVPFGVADLAATLAPNAQSDAERALKVFRYALQTTNYYDAHYCETLPTGHRRRVSYTLLKGLNIYPFDQCGPLNYMLRKLFLAAGISSNDASGTHHQFEQAYHGGDWRLFDLSPRVYWLNRDNRTVAGRRAFEDDPYLKLRQGSGITSALRGRPSAPRFGQAVRPHSMRFALRAGERVGIGWHNEGRWFELTDDRRPIPLAKVPPYFGNGAIIFEPAARTDAAAGENMTVERLDDGTTVLRPTDPARAAALIYRAACPYIFSDGRVVGVYEAAAPGAIRLSLSFDRGKKWSEVWRSGGEAGRMDVSLLPHVSARYAYRLKLAVAPGADARVTGLNVRSTFVASPLALPGRLSLGENRIRFVGGPVTRPVRTTCRWTERHRSDLGVSLNALSYYLNGDEAHRNVFVARPGEKVAMALTLRGRRLRGEASVEGLPPGWAQGRTKQSLQTADASKPATATFTFLPGKARPGEVRGFDVVLREGGRERRVAAEVLVADAPLVREAERADEVLGKAAAVDVPEASGAKAVAFADAGKLAFAFTADRAGTCALWLRARWLPDSSTRMALALDGRKPRSLRAAAMIGFTDWTDPARAHTKMFAHYGEQYAHWSWYRIPEVRLTAGRHRLTLGADKGARFDALVLLPAVPEVDRAAMNLFQNWNYAPWLSPF